MTKRSGQTLELAELKRIPPKVMEVRLSAEGLAEAVLQLGPRNIVVSEADGFADYRLSTAVDELIKNPQPDLLIHNITLGLYPSLIACSSGDIPTPDEFMRMGKDAQRLWIETARELNPHEKINGVSWWSFLESMEAPNGKADEEVLEDLKKKEAG